MKEIKTSKKAVKGLSPAGQRMKNAFIQTKAKAEQQIREQEAQQKAAPVEYAENAIAGKAQAGAKKAARLLNQRGKKAVRNLPKNLRAVKQKTKSAVKTAQKSIKTAKTAGKTIKTTTKTAQTTAKTTAKTAQATVKTSRVAAKAAATTAKATGKAVVAAGKAIAAAVKALIEIIVAGGWIAVIVILVIVMIAAVVMAFVGEDGELPDISSSPSFTSSYFEPDVSSVAGNG